MNTLLANPPLRQHLVLAGASWNYYERTLEELAGRSLRVAFLDGTLEILSPLPEHEAAKRAFGDLIGAIAEEWRIPRKSFSSVTLRQAQKGAGIEPDECFYFHDIEDVKGMTRFDPHVHRPPDLAIEIAMWNPSVPRKPIYARLGVPELWRYDGNLLRARSLRADRSYGDTASSLLFPFLPLDAFGDFVKRMVQEDETQVLLQFREWVRTLRHGRE